MKTKNIADSILNGITIEDDLILELYSAKELRRLARINHLGIVHFVYPMAKHYRFEHSLGVYELTRRLLGKLNPDVEISTRRAVLAAALLHDLGHGPYSHLFELISPKEHEEYSIDIIRDENTDVYKAFEKIEPTAREQVVQILKGEHPISWCNQIVSSEIDMDRLDYLLRDSQSTGAAYGQIDWRWLLKNARIWNDKLVFKETALTVIESMLLGRYHMNIAVYWNPKNVANQIVFKGWFKRMMYLKKNNLLKGTYRYLDAILSEREMTVEEFLKVDDSIVNSAIMYSTEEDDEIIRTIAEKFLAQELPDVKYENDEIEAMLRDEDPNLKGQTWDVIEIAMDFGSYQKKSAKSAIILTANNEEKIATEYSTVINLNQENNKRVKRIGVKVV